MEQSLNNQQRANRIFAALKKDYTLIGAHRIKGWHIWLSVGVLVGAVGGISLVANRSGEFEAGRAAEENGYSEELIFARPEFYTETEDGKRIEQLFSTALQLNAELRRENVDRAAIIRQMKNILRERTILLKELAIKNSPVASLSLVPATMRSQFPPDVQAMVEQEAQEEGTVEVLHEDDFQNRSSKDFYSLRAGKRVQPLTFAGVPPSLSSGSRVRVRGFQIDHHLIIPLQEGALQILSIPPLDAIGEQKTLAVLVNFSDSPAPPFSREEAHKLVFEGQMQAFYRETSHGKISWKGTTIGWHTLPRPAMVEGGCKRPQFDEVYQMIKGGTDVSQYDRLIILYDHPLCGGGGGATRGKEEVVLDSGPHKISIAFVGLLYFSSPIGKHPFTWTNLDEVLSHELGHALGVGHANTWDCAKKRALYGRCQSIEYGNYYDIMGYGGYTFSLHFNAFYKEVFGWVSDASLNVIRETGVYRLNPFENASGVLAAKIHPPFLENAPLYLEYRQALGFDANLGKEPQAANTRGLMVNWIPSLASPLGLIERSLLLDMSPGDISNFSGWDKAALLPGKTFRDPGRGITIGPVVEANDKEIVFHVKMVPPRCVRNNPVLMTSSGATVTPGASAHFGVNVFDFDSPTCSPSNFTVSVIAPPGWSHSFSAPNTFLLEPEGTYGSTYGEITVPGNASPGTYKVIIRATSAQSGKSTDREIIFTIL